MRYLFLPLLLLSFTSWAQDDALTIRLEKIRQQYNLPSLSAAILKDGVVNRIGATGVREIGKETKVTTNDKYHLGSATKSMTATLAAIIIEEGKLKWKATLSDLFPELVIHEAYKDVTFDMLLSHRSGMFRGIPQYEEIKQAMESAPGVIEKRSIVSAHLLMKSPEFKPDTKDSYSNVAYVVAAHVLERITKRSWEELITEKIFSKLSMNSCGFGPLGNIHEATPSAPIAHISKQGTLTPIFTDNSPIWGPAGRVHCNLVDWSKYLQAHLDGANGKENLLKSESFIPLQTIFPTSEMSYTAGGWFKVKRDWANGTAFVHNGTNLANYAKVWLVPEMNAALMVVTNMGGDEKFTGNDPVLDKTAEAVEDATAVLIDELRSSSSFDNVL
jgi:CubicO group peptidase (beta-lactamase class C family)